MIDCCITTKTANNPPRKYRCPVNGLEYSGVSVFTIMHHIKQPWNWAGKEQGYYFCDDPDCEVVYFGEDNSVLKKNALRTSVGVKERTDSSLVCYCFGISFNEAGSSPNRKEFVVKQTKRHACACEARNPSGKCCLKDFPE